MNIDSLVRDPKEIDKRLTVINNNLVALEKLKVIFPENYIGTPLCHMGDEIKMLAMFGIVADDKYYGVSKACALMVTEPTTINVITIKGEKYMEFGYDPGAKIIKNQNLLRTATLVYRIYSHFVVAGNYPWYFDEADVAFMFDTALSHGNANLRANVSLLALLAAVVSRQLKNKTLFHRHDPNLGTPGYDQKPFFIPLRSISLGTTNTTSKLLGNYFSEALTSALTTRSTQHESIETILRN